MTQRTHRVPTGAPGRGARPPSSRFVELALWGPVAGLALLASAWTSSSGPAAGPGAASADLRVWKTASPDPAAAGSLVTYMITVKNLGPDSANSVTVTDTLPASVSFQSCAATGGGTCGGSGRVRKVTFSSLAAGVTQTVTHVVKVRWDTPDGTLVRNVAVASSSTPDPKKANNTAAASIRVGSTVGPRFEDASVALGVEEATETWGLAVMDWDRDGCDDLYVGRHATIFPRLYRNGCPGPFTDEVGRLHLAELPWSTTKDRHAVAFGDFDADGRQDLFIATGGGGGTGHGADDQLFHQLADGDFEDVAPLSAMQDRTGSGRFGMWFDAEGDGDLDLFLGHFVHPERPEENRNVLWRNLGGLFVNRADTAGLDASESALSGVAADLDLDGDMDLVVVPGRKSSLYTNRGNGTFDFASFGFGQTVSVAPGDYDDDGDTDLFFARATAGGGQSSSFEADATGCSPGCPPPSSILLRNDGPAGWRNVSAAAGVAYPYGQSALWLDANNDGDLDLFVTRGAQAGGGNAPDLLLVNRGDGTFEEQAAAAGVAGSTDGGQDGAAWGDFNRDGHLDLAVVSSFAARAVRVYLNQGGSNHWIVVRLADDTSANRQGVGAKVWVETAGATRMREVTTGTALKSQSPRYVHVGLGSEALVARLLVRWPDGTELEARDLPADTRYVARKGEGVVPE